MNDNDNQREIIRGRILVRGYVGLSGTRRLLKTEELRLRFWFPEGWLACAGKRLETLASPPSLFSSSGGCRERPEADLIIRENGIEQTLFTLARDKNFGFRIDLERIPLLQETVEICECLGEDPFRIDSSGMEILFQEENSGDYQGFRRIGYLTEKKDRVFLFDHGRQERMAGSY